MFIKGHFAGLPLDKTFLLHLGRFSDFIEIKKIFIIRNCMKKADLLIVPSFSL
jgi:hypothetical protein